MCVTLLYTICKYCFIIFVFIYGIFYITFEMIQTVVPVGALLMGFVGVGFYALKVPPPDPKIVEMVIGKYLMDEKEDPSGYYMKSVAHRGAGLDAPENSLAAFDLCAQKGCTAIEFDLALTADDVPIIFHDDTLERMTNSDKIVNKTTWKELSKYDISLKHPLKDQFVNTRIPTLKEAIELMLKHNLRMFIDIKSTDTKIINIVMDLYKQYPELYSKTVITSFYPNLIYKIRRRNPKIVGGLAWEPQCCTNECYPEIIGSAERKFDNKLTYCFFAICDSLHEWFLTRITYKMLGLSCILLHRDVISPRVVSDWRDKGVQVFTWTVNDPVQKQYFSRCVKVAYMTDSWIDEKTAHSSP